MEREPSPCELRAGSAEQAGFDPARLERAFGLVEEFVSSGRIPGAVVAVGRRGLLVGPRAYGWAQVVPEHERRPMTNGTVFDLASLTKPMATAPSILKLVELGVLTLQDSVARWLPDVAAGTQGRQWAHRVTLWHLLTHTSGLPAYRNLYAAGQGPAEVLAELGETPLSRPPGVAVEYSCLGFILLGEIVKRASGEPLDRFAERHFYRPLGMEHTRFNPPPGWAGRCAATERYPDTGEVAVGRVHDRNARAMGGVSGNAGLFSTAEDVARFMAMMLCEGMGSKGRLLEVETVREMRRLQTPGLNEPRGLGWVVRDGDPRGSGGRLLSPEAFGHTGFTGTSAWADPVTGAFFVLLTNRVHPTRDNTAHLQLRPWFHDAAAAAVVDAK
ncbi:serine hydrolase domain-containing protein [Carboxydochorda subterranea]|uniref:Serine hydrolase domain-containing protein n=1 Tax=Carboxydichorda subterranea TaxID=3109565 RepID=A0ABZ1BVX6_9FIRM|nr:serine hydrolase domain-containing protein [Limnochorda sp. L945t]WRP16770.1 serine hydrolase domain-containing protein [Limnochorda sp. L945t]